jgi:hypothetical protein
VEKCNPEEHKLLGAPNFKRGVERKEASIMRGRRRRNVSLSEIEQTFHISVGLIKRP